MLPDLFRLQRWLPPDISTQGPGIDWLLLLLHVFMLVLFSGWGVYLLYCLVRFRWRDGTDRQAPAPTTPPEISGLPRYLEMGILLFEIFLLLFLAGPLWGRIQNRFPDERTAEVIRVVAEQYAWNVHYPGRDRQFGAIRAEKIGPLNPLGLDRETPAGRDDIVVVNELHVPVHRPVIVLLSSKDVIHSFFLPAMRVKQDAIPGVPARLWFEATRTGSFDIACAQLCGNGHFRMRGRLIVDSAEDYADWLARKAKAQQ